MNNARTLYRVHPDGKRTFITVAYTRQSRGGEDITKTIKELILGRGQINKLRDYLTNVVEDVCPLFIALKEDDAQHIQYTEFGKRNGMVVKIEDAHMLKDEDEEVVVADNIDDWELRGETYVFHVARGRSRHPKHYIGRYRVTAAMYFK